jgi:hypothetical protein
MSPLNLYARVRSPPFFAHGTAGAARTRHSLRPLISRRKTSEQTSGDQRRETMKLYLLFEIRIRGREAGRICVVPPCDQKGVWRASAEVR